MHNKFYFLHVPKTGGRFLINNFIFKFPESIKIIEGEHRHNGWIKDIDDETYIFSIIREPIKAICSLYCHIVATKSNILVEDSTYNSKIKKMHLDKNAFISWITKAKKYHNMQSKNFLISSSVIDSVYWYANFKDLDTPLLEKRLKRVNFLTTHDMLLNNLNFVTDKICKDLNINNIIVQNDKNTYSNEASKTLYNSLNSFEKNEISIFFEMDYKIYNRLKENIYEL